MKSSSAPSSSCCHKPIGLSDAESTAYRQSCLACDVESEIESKFEVGLGVVVEDDPATGDSEVGGEDMGAGKLAGKGDSEAAGGPGRAEMEALGELARGGEVAGEVAVAVAD
jgi:hypothetical protein